MEILTNEDWFVLKQAANYLFFIRIFMAVPKSVRLVTDSE